MQAAGKGFAMIGPCEDQASSLRRLLGGSTLRSALFIGGDAGIGQTALVAATAEVMARRGHAVLVVDAQPQLRSGAGWFGLSPRGDLAEALSGQRRLDEVLLHAAGGVTWVPAARLGPASASAAADPTVAVVAAAAARALSDLAVRFDCVLVDVPADRVRRWWPAAAQAGSVLLGSTTAQRSVTAAYAALKMLALEVGQQRYLWWMARAADAGAAEAAWHKVAQTARRFLQVQVEYAGAMPVDPMVARAERLRRPLAEAFPGSLAAAASAMLAERLDVPMPLLGTPEQAWQALLLGESARAGEPAQNENGGAGLAIDRDAPRSPSYSSDLSPNPSPSQKLSPFGAPGRTALVSR
ncbi:MAG: hypothetical protein NTW37_09005 [Proteobacteria bacterium]|nr:hypothetical protein [Pseudomonadota bacterium]